LRERAKSCGRGVSETRGVVERIIHDDGAIFAWELGGALPSFSGVAGQEEAEGMGSSSSVRLGAFKPWGSENQKCGTARQLPGQPRGGARDGNGYPKFDYSTVPDKETGMG
jgi:hypothetical protein